MSFDLTLSVDFFHESDPEFDDVVEILVLFVTLFLDFFGRIKYVSQIEPISLKNLPLLDRVGNRN